MTSAACAGALSLLQEAERLIEAGLAARIAKLDEERNTVATYSGRMVGLDDDALVNLATDHGDTTVAACAQAAKSRRTSAQEDADRAKWGIRCL